MLGGVGVVEAAEVGELMTLDQQLLSWLRLLPFFEPATVPKVSAQVHLGSTAYLETVYGLALQKV